MKNNYSELNRSRTEKNNSCLIRKVIRGRDGVVDRSAKCTENTSGLV